jgi:hypothetical protein
MCQEPFLDTRVGRKTIIKRFLTPFPSSCRVDRPVRLIPDVYSRTLSAVK